MSFVQDCSPLTALETDFVEGRISQQDFLFYSDSAAPTANESRGGLRRSLALLMLILGLIGAASSVALLYEEWQHHLYPLATLGCSLNAKVSCVDAFDAWQGHLLFGVPNAVPGLFAFMVLIGISAYLLAGRRLPSWIWYVLFAGALSGVLMVCWFLYVSLFIFQTLCPFCLMVWISVVALAWLLASILWRRSATPDKPFSSAQRALVSYWWVGALIHILLIFAAVIGTLGLAVLGL